MKVESIRINNFKRFEQLEVSFQNQTVNTMSNRFLVLGDNGTGKTTLLQAIALPLALATRQIQRVTDFDWLGFLPGRYQRWGAPQIELCVVFSSEEIATTRVPPVLYFKDGYRCNPLPRLSNQGIVSGFI
jgi:AAA ATPase domain